VITDIQLRRLAEQLTLPEPQFAALFDEILAANGGGTTERFKVLKLMKEPGELSFEAALKVARDRGWLDALTGRLLAVDGIPDADELTPGVQTVLQGITQPQAGFFDAGVHSSGALRARRRVCRIKVRLPGDEIYGSGFLVGPQAVLTAGHLLAPLIDELGRERPGSAELVTVEFDYIAGVARPTSSLLAEEWLIGFSRAHPSEQPGVSILDFDQTDPAGFDAALDYAIIRLEKAIGSVRGSYSLDKQRFPRIAGNANNQLLVFQHPAGQTMKSSTGAGTQLWPDNFRTRLRHNANTMSGSSGGLVLDADLEPIALHQCGLEDEHGNAIANGAIPTACIAAIGHDCRSIVGFDPILRTLSGHAVLGREEFQRLVLTAAAGERPLLVVRGEAKAGKSFSKEILKTQLAGPEHLFVELGASEIPADAFDLARLILGKLHSGEEALDLSPPSEADTARDAWIRDVLFPGFLEGLRSAAGARILWLVFDDLEKRTLPNASSRRLLERLYQDIRSAPFLRVVLIGLAGSVPAAPHEAVAYDTARDFLQEEVEEYLSRRMVEAGRAPGGDEVRILAATIIDDADDQAEPKVPVIANQAARRADRLIRDAGGAVG
jgi:trypsin-like peptidase